MSIVDLTTYPIDDLMSEHGGALVAHARRQLVDTSAFRLPGFLSEDGLSRCRAEVEALEPQAHFSDHQLTPNYDVPDPRARTVRLAVGYVSREHIPMTSLFRALFEGDTFPDFLRTSLPGEPLYHYSDKRGPLNVTVMREGDELGWHFDVCELVASIPFRASTSGGEFNHVPDMRAPGDLLLFRGRHSLHRVRPIEGGINRLMGLMSFDNVAETSPNAATERLFGGS